MTNQIFVRCPEGNTLCLQSVDPTTETVAALKHRIATKLQAADEGSSLSSSSSSNVQAMTTLFQFFVLLGWMRKLNDDLFLTYEGKPLRDQGIDSERTLSEYNVQENATLHASIRVRGGCFMVSLSLLCIIVGALMMSVFTCGGSLIIIPFLAPFLFILPFFCL